MTPRPTRRAVLLRTTQLGFGAGAAAVLASCGAPSNSDDASQMSLAPLDSSTRLLVAVFQGQDYVVAGIPQRTAFALGLPEGGLVTEETPDLLTFEIHRIAEDGTRTAVGDPIDVSRHQDGVPVDYYPLRTTYPEAGTYVAVTRVGDSDPIEATFGVVERDALAVPQPGDAMPQLPTPTFAAPLEVDPICTRDPECPLHEISLDQAVASGTPTVLLVSTPAFCQLGVCGPVLDLVLETQAEFPDITFLHCEVYRNENGPTSGELVGAVETLGLTWEPSLFVIGADGVLETRLDNVFDRRELTDALTAVG